MTDSTAIAVWLEDKRDELCALLPSSVHKDRFLRNIIMQVKMNEGLKNCTSSSIAKACIQASTLGLDIGVLGSAYLVPYGNEAQLSVGYQGYIDLAYRSGMKAIHTGIVRQNDDYKATEENFEHEYDPFASEEYRGPVVGVYCIVELPTGATYSELMTTTEVEQIRCASRSANSPAWRDHWGEMAKKVVIRRALKRAPLSVETKEIIHDSDKAEFSYNDKAPVVGKEGLRQSLETSRKEITTTVSDSTSIWDEHLVEGKKLSKEMNIKTWYKINPARQNMLAKRINKEGFKVHEVKEFWTKTREAFLPFDVDAAELKNLANLDTLLRVPKDHDSGDDFYVCAMSGYFRPTKKESTITAGLEMKDGENTRNED